MGIKVLMIDDSSTIRSILKRTLGLSGLPIEAIYEAASAEEGMECLSSKAVDLVLTDLNMPGMGGEALVAALRDDARFQGLPIVVISSEGNSSVIESLYARGVRKVMRKPFNPGELRLVVEEIMS
jgi:two-component system chemotaxis response regulator CheY